MGGFLIVNARAGNDRPSADELVDAAVARGIEVHAFQLGEDVGELARGAPDGPLGVAGGDGSLAAVAAVALERELPFVCVPFGTRNHFARDLGLDRDDPIGALDAFDGVEHRIDVGRVHERVFLNNVSLGLYAQLVHERERHRRRRHALARLRALGIAARSRGERRLFVDEEPLDVRMLVLANNAYALDFFSVGERERLDEGLLYLYAANSIVRSSWTERSATRFVIDAPAGRIEAAIDGEPARLETPLEFGIDPLALRVLVPPA